MQQEIYRFPKIISLLNKNRTGKPVLSWLISLSKPHLTQLMQNGVFAIVDLPSFNPYFLSNLFLRIFLSVDHGLLYNVPVFCREGRQQVFHVLYMKLRCSYPFL